jgi:hypothetical protein
VLTLNAAGHHGAGVVVERTLSWLIRASATAGTMSGWSSIQKPI